MKSPLLRTAVTYAGRWGAIVFFVVLLTLIFSFLGTIICAVLAGMMMGATKHARWHTIPISIVFPAVIFTLLRSSKAEMVSSQINGLSLLCFGAFWLTYLVTAAVIAFERKPVPATATVPSRPPALNSPPELGLAARAGVESRAGTRWAAPVEPAAELSLEDLQGKWTCEAAVQDGASRKKTIEIKDGKLILSIIDPDGQVRVCESDVRLDNSGPPATLTITRDGDDPLASI